MGEGRVTRRLPPRIYPKCLLALLFSAALVGSLLHLAGASAEGFFLYLSLATTSVILAALAWEVIERRVLRPSGSASSADEPPGEESPAAVPGTRPDAEVAAPRPPGLLAWLAFPASISFGVASVPFLVLLVYPPAEEFFTEAGRVRASVSRQDDSTILEIHFPEPTTRSGENLRINGEPLPEGYMRDHPEVFFWRGTQTLSVRTEPLLRDLGLERIETVGVNLLAGVPRFAYLSGTTVPRQVIDVP